MSSRGGHAGIHFLYPSYFTWEADIQGNHYKCWTMSGNDVKITCFIMAVAVSVDAFVEGIIEQFGPRNCKIEKTSRKLGGKLYSGKRITVRIRQIGIVQDVYPIHGAPGARFLVLQDNLCEPGESIEEAERTTKLLQESFRAD